MDSKPLVMVHRVPGRFQMRLTYRDLFNEEVKKVLDSLLDVKLQNIAIHTDVHVRRIHGEMKVVTELMFDTKNRTTCNWDNIDEELKSDEAYLLTIGDRIEELTGIG